MINVRIPGGAVVQMTAEQLAEYEAQLVAQLTGQAPPPIQEPLPFEAPVAAEDEPPVEVAPDIQPQPFTARQTPTPVPLTEAVPETPAAAPAAPGPASPEPFYDNLMDWAEATKGKRPQRISAKLREEYEAYRSAHGAAPSAATPEPQQADAMNLFNAAPAASAVTREMVIARGTELVGKGKGQEAANVVSQIVGKDLGSASAEQLQRAYDAMAALL